MKKMLLKKLSWNRLSKGFFSIEMIIVLVVALSILAAAAGRIGQLFTASNSASAASNILSLETSIQSLRSVDGFGADGTDLLELLKISHNLPSTLSVNNGKVFNEWAGEVKIVVTNGGQGFTITYPKIPSSAASSLIIQLLSGGTFSAVKINSKQIVAPATSADILQALKDTTEVTAEFMVGPVSNTP